MSKKKTLPKKHMAPANKVTKEKAAPTNDIQSKTIFKNPLLCSQFLRNYVNHPMVKNIRPEDIEDYTDRFLSYFGVEYDADTVKKIQIRDEKGKKFDFFLVSLIEHKTDVDYNVVVQLLKYMACIWAEYEKQFGADYKDQVKTKGFRYPPILPVVYHEGSDTWTAPMHLKERIFMHEIFEEYIPDFTYCLVDNHKFSNEELLERKDEMSLIMLLNKIQDEADLSEFLRISAEDINRIVKESPEAVIDIIVMVMQALCTKLNLSRQDTEECVRKVRSRDMGYLWANMKKIDVQEAQAQVKQAEEQVAQAKEQVAQAEEKVAQAEAQVAQAEAQVKQAEEQVAQMQAENTRLKALLEEHGIEVSEA